MSRCQDPTNSITHDLIKIWCGCAYILTHLTVSHLNPSLHLLLLQLYLTYVTRPPSENPNFYINPLHPPLLLFLFLSLVVSPWANLWIHPSSRHQYSMWESRKGLQAPHIYRSICIYGLIFIVSVAQFLYL